MKKLSERIRPSLVSYADEYVVRQWAKEAKLLEAKLVKEIESRDGWRDAWKKSQAVVEAAKRAIAIIYDIGYAAIPTAIDLEEAIDRLEEANG